MDPFLDHDFDILDDIHLQQILEAARFERVNNTHDDGLPRRNKICEARLYVGFQSLRSSKQFMRCRVDFQGSNYETEVGEDRRNEIILDIFDFYGPSMLKFTFYKTGFLRSNQIVGTFEIPLRDIYRSTLVSNNLPTRDPDISNTSNSDSNSIYSRYNEGSNNYWVFTRESTFLSPKKNCVPYRVLCYGRYVPMEACMKLYKSVDKGKVNETELHIAAQKASPHVITDLLAMLSRENTLAYCLKLRSRIVTSALNNTENMTKQNMSHDYAVDLNNDINNLELTPFEAALICGNTAAARVMLQRAGNLCFEGISKSSNTPVHSAVRGGIDVLKLLIKFLVQYGPKTSWDVGIAEILEWRDAQNRTPIMLAAIVGDNTMVDMLANMGCNVGATGGHALILNCGSRRCDDGSTAESVCNKLTSIRASDDSWTPLMYAAVAGHVHVVNSLLKYSTRDASFRLQPRNSSVSESYLSSLRCAPCARSCDGLTALMLAIKYGRTEVADALICGGLPLLSECKLTGDSSLHIAAATGNMDICMMIAAAESIMWNSHLDGVEEFREKYKKSVAWRNFQNEGRGKDESGQEHSVYVGMLAKHKLLLSVNYRGLDAGAVAMQHGFVSIADKLRECAAIIYEKDEVFRKFRTSDFSSVNQVEELIIPNMANAESLKDINLIKITDDFSLPEGDSEFGRDVFENLAYNFALARKPKSNYDENNYVPSNPDTSGVASIQPTEVIILESAAQYKM